MRLHGEGRAGRGVAEKTDGRQDAGGISGGSRNERAECAEWQHGAYPSQRREPHTWRTRSDPFSAVFESDVVPLLAADEKRVLESADHPGRA